MAVNSIDPNTGVEIQRNMYLDNTEIIDGARYTTQEDPNQLTNTDFLELMLTEMKMQDPTKPMDTDRMVDNQLKMSTIQANLDMTESMIKLQTAYSNSALSTAANLIGKTIENGEVNADGVLRSYNVETVENIDGELYVNGREMIGIVDGMKNSETDDIIKYDSDGYFYSIDDEEVKYQLILDDDGRFTYDDEGNIKMKDADGNEITDTTILEKYAHAGSAFDYASEQTKIPVSSIMQIR